MHHSRRKSFDWYGLKQHFSIRKYHFGATSVLLGMSIALGTGTQVVQAAETVTTPESTSVASSTSATESTTSETSTETATSSSSERTVEIGYIVKYATEEGTLVNASVETVSVTTTETIAKATVSVTAVVPEGYELASVQSATVSQEVTENGVNIVTVKVVKKAEEKAATSETTTTASTETATAKSTEDAATTTATVSEAVKTPATVEEAKTVLEQVTSEAEVLANEGNRIVATDTTTDTSALKAVAAATKLVATDATSVLQDTVATLDALNAQITAVRTSVEALALELRKYLGTDLIQVALTTTTTMDNGTGVPGTWKENQTVNNKDEAATSATLTPSSQDFPAGYVGDPNTNRTTFMIYSLSGSQDSSIQPGILDGSFNLRRGTDFYMVLSVNRSSDDGDFIYLNLYDKKTGQIALDDNGNKIQEELAVGVGEVKELTGLNAYAKQSSLTQNFKYTLSLTETEFKNAVGESSVLRNMQLKSNMGASALNTLVYSNQTASRGDYNDYSGAAPTYTPRQVTSYFVKATDLRDEEFLASYTQNGDLSGEHFTIAGEGIFDNYELIESPTTTNGTLASDYVAGTALIRWYGGSLQSKVQYITKDDGSARYLQFLANPDHPDFLETYAKYKTMSETDFQAEAETVFRLAERIAIVEKVEKDIAAVNADTTLSDSEKTAKIQTIRTEATAKINTADDKFFLTYSGENLAPLAYNDTADVVTGLDEWNYTSTKYKFSANNVTSDTLSSKVGTYQGHPKAIWNNVNTGILTILDQDGKPVINPYTNQKMEFKGFDLSMFNSNAGNFNNQVYYYAEKGGVKVYYVDTEGKVLQDAKSVYDHEATNTAYDTKSVKDEKITTADGTVYYYKEIDTTGLNPASSNTDTEKRTIEKITEEVGTVAQDTLKEMTYVYEKAGNVNVNYVDVDGNKLSGTDGTGKVVTEKVADLVNAKAGTGYDTIVDNRPAKIVTADGKTYELAPAAEYTVGTVEADHHLSVSNVTEVTGVHEATGSVASGITKEITFVYKEVTGKVIVNFKSIDGEVLQGPRTDTEEGSTGRDYNTEGEGEVPPTITKDGKTYKLVPNLTNGNPTGKVTPGTTEVTYYYQLVTGDVVVNYENTDGKTIAQQKVDVNNGNIGDAYDTRDEGDKPEKIVEDGTGDVYYIKPAGTEVKIGNGLSGETGRVVEGTTQVTYIYEKAGNVKINYILDDAAGTTLKDSVMDEENAKPGTAYDTTDEGDKPETITKDGKVYRLKEVKADSAAENGDTAKIVAGTTLEVTYVYTEVKSDVVVEYYDTEGNLLTGKTDTGGNVDKRVTDTTQASVGTPYNTDEDHRPATITTADGTIYHYIELKEGSAQPEGTVAETTTTVQYVYAKAGSVVIRYVKEDDKGIQSELQPNVLDEDNVKPGTPYDTTDEGNKPTTITTEDGKTYTLVRKEGHDETGEVAAGETKEITYVYKEVTGKVIVHYVDQDGNPISGTTDEGKKTASTVTDTPESSTGTPYNTTDLRPNTITTADGKIYKRVPAATIGKEDGKVVEGTTEVTYVYELLQGDVIVHYVDTEGNTIADDVTDQVITDTGTEYDTRDNKPEKIVNDETGDVYYILPKDEVKAGDKETGKVVEGTTEVTYIYQKAGSVNVNYVDTEGNVLKDPVADVTDGKPGSGYDTVLDNKLASISVDGKLYRLVPAGTYNVGTVSGDNNLTAAGNGKATGIDATTGTVEAGVTKEITYVYQEVKGDVIVEYYDTEGNTIAKTEVDTPTTSVDTPYETYDHKPATITVVEKDGSETLYYYKEVKDTSAPEKGDVVEGTTTVQYVYEKAGNVNVNYVDTEGNVIQAPVADVTDGKPDSAYATTDHKPEEITTADGKTYRLVEAGTYNVGTVSDDNNLTAVGNGKATGIDATTGTVEAGTTKEITYVYEEVKGNVVVNYITTDGTVIKQPVEDTPTSSTGTPYDTKDNKPTTITTEDGKTYRIVPVLTKGSETGKVVEGTTSITYVYEEVKGDVVVEYYDTEGNLISGLSDSGEAVDTKEVDTPSTSTGTAYNTDEDHKPNTITTADGTVYYYKEVKDTSASTTGKVVEGTTTVQYVYEKAGNVIVHYITEDGTVIKATVTDEENAKPGKSYDTTDNKPVEIVTEDGSRYVLIPSKTIGTENGTVEGGKTIEITYVYKKVANWLPQIPGVPEGQEPKVPYPFDPTNPDVPVTPTPDTVIPNVPGYTPVDPKDNTPLKPVDPNDPGKGYVPPTPDDSGVDTPVPYVQNGNVVVNYVDENGNVLKTPVNDETDAPAGKSYDTTDNKPTEIVTEDGSRYVLIPSKTIGTENGTVEGGKTIEITYVYKKVANWIPQIPGVPEGQEPKVPYPFDPTNPDVPVTPTPDTVIPNVPGYTPVDPKTNEPLKPVDPTDPGKGYVPPTPDDSGVDTPVPYVQNGNVVVNYVDENGNVLKTPVNDETDAPAGKSYDTTDNKPTTITTEDGSRYVLIPSKTIGTENGTVEGGKTIEITYVYKKVANWIPQIPGVPEGQEPKVPYPFDPTNPDVPVTPTPDTVIPNVPGYTPVDPKTNEPLKPFDPTDPGKGYVPPTPDDSGVDTPVPYVQNGNVVVNYVDENGNVLKTPVNDETDAPAGKSYDTTDNKPVEIVTEDGSRYVLIPSKTVGSETGTVEGGKTIEITYVYKKVANWVPQIPGVPEGQEPKVPYPFDPTNPNKPIDPTTPGTNGEVPSIPHVPGFTPVDPKTNEPLKPVDPTDPGKGYVPPTPDETGVDTPIPYVQNGNVVVNYVDENGNVLKTPVNDETDAPAGKSYDTTDNKPVEIVTEDGSRYVLIPSKTIGTENGTVEGGKTTEITYVYKKVANWIPEIPGVPENERPVIPYPFDPNNPDVPVTPTPGTVIPNVPGYTPVDPKDNTPLKPVDPNDPGKGYVPPTPENPGEDTPIPYVQNGNVVVNYVTEDGTVIKSPVKDETDAPAGKSYDTTDNKPNTITTEDGTTYELVRVDGSETGTVVGGKTTEVTYVYRKVTPAKKVVTNHVDENGTPIAPQEEGTTPNKSIPGYEFTGKTVTDPDGNTTHIYRKVTKVVTNHVDEDGNPIAPQEEGTTPNKSIPGYEFTGKTVTDSDGNTTHIYRKVSKPVAPKPQAPVAPTTAKAGAAQLPNTGEASSSATVLGAGMLIAALALAGKRRRNED